MKFFSRINRLSACIGLLLFVGGLPVQSEEMVQRQKIGISTALQNSQVDIILPIWVDSRLVFSPSIGFSTISDVASDLRLVVMLRYNLRDGNAVPYIGARMGILTVSPKYGASESDTIVGGAIGGEYFFSKNFSAGVEGQVNAAISGDKSSRFGNPGGTNLNTSTSALMTFYF